MVRETKEACQTDTLSEEAFRATLPKRIFEAQLLASNLGITVNSSLTATGPRVVFSADDGETFIETSLTYETEDWEISELENDLRRLKHKKDEQAARLQAAQVAFNKLSREEQQGVKEFIYYMKVKPN